MDGYLLTNLPNQPLMTHYSMYVYIINIAFRVYLSKYEHEFVHLGIVVLNDVSLCISPSPRNPANHLAVLPIQLVQVVKGLEPVVVLLLDLDHLQVSHFFHNL